MTKLVAKMRWYPGDPLVPIERVDLDALAKQHGLRISVEDVEDKNRRMVGGILREDTETKTIEEITQTVVIVSASDEGAFRNAIRALIKRYRAPRTTYAAWGSTEEGKRIVDELSDEEDGWF